MKRINKKPLLTNNISLESNIKIKILIKKAGQYNLYPNNAQITQIKPAL